ncbi:fatty acyl-AMP ligase [Winogradskya consettensis]|uniref:Acyl-CoA synthetase n=1 Tax=Winogradskya consettensis TaxID=113560 RepID=A0A919T103_9ACTN|nr:fatty acyl-AMP ligase [Actinoplanes consettensis]GIM82386.1 acyl-CoA synthetase [Actinoplanes consettensis]
MSGLSDLPAVLAQRVAADPSSVVCTMAGDPADEVLTAGELDVAARARAATLVDRGLTGASAVILQPTGLEFPRTLLATHLAGVAGAPVKVPSRGSGLDRVLAIARDARAGAVLTTTVVRDELLATFGDLGELARLDWICTDEIPDDDAAGFRDRRIDPDSTAMLQYTSGSTGSPKGVQVSHRNFCANAADMDDRWSFRVGEDGGIVSWLPIYHDMGLLCSVILPLWTSVPSHLIPSDEFGRRPIRWLTEIARKRATHSAGSNYAYEMALRAASTAPPDLDLTSWRVALIAAEPVRLHTIERFVAAYAPYGLDPAAVCPAYGLAENTLKVSGSRAGEPHRTLWVSAHELSLGRVDVRAADDPAAVPLISCGRPDGRSEVVVVDPDTGSACDAATVGEIWICGPCVATGYLGRPRESAETFRARVRDGYPEQTFLRTGDLGFLHEGELFVVGRHRDVIHHRGRRLFPQDIEHTVEFAAPGLFPACAAAFGTDPDAGLVIVLEVNGRVVRETPADVLRDLVRTAVENRHGVPVTDVLLIRRGTLPRTTSGKVQRRACRDAYLDGELTVFGPAVAQRVEAPIPA